jgi:glycosyltransferase involved in cell wall biosynthesis
VIIVRSHGLEHVAHEQLMMDVREGRVQLSWKYPLYRGRVRLWQVAKSLREADRAVFSNAHDRDVAVDRLGVAAERARVVPNGIPSDLCGLALAETPPPGGPLRIALVGSYIRRKGVRYAAEALAPFLSGHPEARVTFAGTACPVEQVLRDYPPSLHAQLGVVPRYTRAELPRILFEHHVKLFPSTSEGFSLALIEAMACGLAPIVTASPGVADAIDDGQTGLVVPARDPGALEGALQHLANHRDELDRLRRAAYEHAQSLTWSAVAARNVEIYEEALAERRR